MVSPSFKETTTMELAYLINLAVIATAGVLVDRGADMSQAEIGKLGGTTRVQQNVEALYVPVDDVVGVEKVQSLGVIFGEAAAGTI